MINKTLLTVIFSSLFFKLAFSQSNYLFESLTVKDGLSQNTVNCIFQDSYGFMWFGTEHGLNKYDGYNFTKYIHDPSDSNSLGGLNCRGIFEDTTGNLWCSTGNSISTLSIENSENGKFINYTMPTIWGIEESKIYPDSIIWIGSKKGINYFNKKKLIIEKYRTSNNDSSNFHNEYLYKILEDRLGNLWVTTASSKLTCIINWADSSKKIEDFPNLLKYTKKDIDFYGISSLFEDSKGNIWIGSYGGGVIKIPSGSLNEKDFILYHKKAKGKYKIECNFITNSIIEDKNGLIWISTDGAGIMKLNLQTDKTEYIKYNSEGINTLSTNRILALYFDQEDILWAGTKDMGIIKITKDSPCFNYFPIQLENKLSAKRKYTNVWTIRKSRMKNHFWAGLDQGLCLLKKQGKEFVKISEFTFNTADNDNLNNLQIRDIYEDQNSILWIATLHLGLIRLNIQSGDYEVMIGKRNNIHSPSSNYIYCIERENETLWLGLNNGALTSYNLQTKKFKEYLFNNVTSKEHFITTIKKSKLLPNKLWIGEWNYGLVLFDTKLNTFKFYYNNSNKSQNINDNCITAIFENEKQNTIWLGTYGGGLLKGEIENLTKAEPKISFKRFLPKDGLANEMIYGILKDDTENLWLSTNVGITKFNPKTEVFSNFSSEDGLPLEGFNLGAALNVDGTMYFGSNGIYYFEPTEHVLEQKPKVVLTSFNKFGKPTKGISLDKKIELSHTDVFFSFEFAALSYKAPDKNHYAYKMVGFDKNWVNIGNKHEAVYTNLDPGEYIFKVKAANSDGVWNDDAFSIDVSISTPFWKNKCYYLTLLVFIGIIIFLTHKMLLNKALKIKENLQSDLARNFHDDTGGYISNIKMLTYNLTKEKGQNKQNMLEQITEQTDKLSNSIKDLLFEINPDKSSLTSLIIYLKDFSDTLFENSSTVFQINGLKDEFDKIHLSSKWKSNLSRIFKEGMTNIIKHSPDCKNVSINVEVRNNFLTMQLVDDGLGFDTSLTSNGNGLKNFKRRATELNAEVEIISKSGSGTELKFYGKLP